MPGIVLSILIALTIAGRVGRVLGLPKVVAAGVIVSLGLVVSATLMPGGDAIRNGTPGGGTCDLGRLGMAPIADVLRFTETGLNVVLLVPLGLMIGLLPRSRTKAVLVLVGITLPFGIEALQLVATSLGRACQSADVIDNLTGFVAGLFIGAALRWAIGSGGALSRDADPG